MGLLRNLSELHPKFQPRVRQWLDAVKQHGIDMLIIESRRTMFVAEAYYAQGRKGPAEIGVLRERAGLSRLSLAESQRIITNARPGLSWHIYGLAVDFVPMVDRKPDWNYTPDNPADYYDEIAAEADKLGMSWGGKWRSFHDYAHVEWHPGWDEPNDAFIWMKQNDAWQIPLAA